MKTIVWDSAEELPRLAKRYETRQDVMEQVNRILNYVEKGNYFRAKQEEHLLFWKLDEMINQVQMGKLKIEPTK